MLSPAIAYRPQVGRYDAAVDASGRARPGWGRLLADLAQQAPDELERRQRSADRIVQAEGASAGEPGLPGQVGVVPYAFATDGWEQLATDLAQRAALLRLVLRDLAGPQELLRAGVVPVEAVATHPGYRQRAIEPVLVTTDVVLDAHGAYRAVRDHADVPTGIATTLLARAVGQRVGPGTAPTGFTPTVAGHADFLVRLRAELAATAHGRANPRIVVLTEADAHAGDDGAYLATRLGYNAADPADVTVRAGRAWLRSLDGLEPIDVLLRHIPAAALDPVADPAVAGGVAGLLQATAHGSVELVNPAGSGLGGHLGLLPFLDAASRFLTGEPLRLTPVPTLWCGDPEHRAEILRAPERFVLLDTAADTPIPTAVGAQLDPAGLADWRARIAARPERYIAQADLARGTAPSLRGGHLVAAEPVIRAHVLLPADAPPFVLPGGQAVTHDGDRATLAADVQVVARGPLRKRATPLTLPQVDLRRSLPAHAAEALHWMGRSAERAETGCRTALVCLTHVVGADPAPGDVVAAVDGLRAVSGGMGGPPTEATVFDLDAEVRAALAGRATSVVDNLRATVRNARAARQMLSARTWRLLAMLEAEAASLAKLAGESGLTAFDATEVLDRVLVPLAALSGLVDESVVRGPGWRFLDVGRRLERALLVLGLVEAMLDPVGPDDEGSLRLEALLAACESLLVYRRSFRSDVTPAAVADLLLGDPTNPRSVRFQLDQLAVDLNDLPSRPVRQRQLAALRRARWALDRHLPLAAGQQPGDTDADDGPLGPAGRLVLAVRAPLLTIGQEMAAGWFAELPRRRS